MHPGRRAGRDTSFGPLAFPLDSPARKTVRSRAVGAALRLAAITALLLCNSSVAPGPVAAEDDTPARDSLRGLTGVHLSIAEVSPELTARGITTDVVFAEVQLQLRQAAIPLLDEQKKPAPGEPELFVEVLANVDPNFDQCSFAFRVELRQLTRLERDAKRPAARAVTWSIGGIGEAGTQWRQILREELAYYVDRFVVAYRTANPL